jgi:hypothetical protein
LRSPRPGPCPAWLGKVCLALLRVLSGDFPVVKGGPLGLSPTIFFPQRDYYCRVRLLATTPRWDSAL